MKQFILCTIGAIATISLPSFAEAKDVKPNKITCEEFVGLDESVQPQLIYFIEGATRSGRKEDMIVSLDEVSKPVAWVLEECNKTPKATVWQKVENYVRKMTKKM